MAQCPACHEEVRTVRLPDGAKVRINAYSEFGKGPHRYVLDSESDDLARLASSTYEGYAHPDHATSCPARDIGQ